MKAPAARGAAVHADDMALARNPLADLKALDIGAEPRDLARIFVADDHRHRDRALRPFVPVVDMHVGAADAGLVHLHQHVVRTDDGNRDVFEPQAGLRFSLTRAFMRGARIKVSVRRELRRPAKPNGFKTRDMGHPLLQDGQVVLEGVPDSHKIDGVAAMDQRVAHPICEVAPEFGMPSREGRVRRLYLAAASRR